ncbi:helix-turn-helix transcriptional regulator [Leptolyngbya sp. NK1-12]|uniref:Helix-turn-helix transcriptional regulator n=1 Tax=Leptolyngbya sp. NK1-12 TaxID=2547451 RepID=A0AA96WJ75_9CYAN|nr:helix-turn-helix transcriptional regulator [Leptolyngbya sp. NK1-12]WNZ25670.1 helix-turn-helix transcriptional regulator [Leptolyngbya sp. NK1-12]
MSLFTEVLSNGSLRAIAVSGLYGMAIRNKVKAVAASKGDNTNYKFWKRTGFSQPTAYRVYRDPTVYLSESVLDTICKVYGVQPGDCLEYVPDEE